MIVTTGSIRLVRELIAAGLALFALPEPPADHRNANYMITLKNVGLDLWGVAKSRMTSMRPLASASSRRS